MKALSIRQPWAWLIVNGFKDIENRSWHTKYRGPVLIHASAHRVTQEEFDIAFECVKEFEAATGQTVGMPSIDQLRCLDMIGGIVGMADITGSCESSSSPWFFGPVGFQLANAKPLPFHQLRGRLSFFDTKLTLVGNQLMETLR
ncbi:ASCH domain-containing protein [Yokenella regensburgei]|uniref:ASCH domain-containing protein n=1 Tax=Yokenella regensburgei TaxID=158877 RepID=UPI003ED9B407